MKLSLLRNYSAFHLLIRNNSKIIFDSKLLEKFEINVREIIYGDSIVQTGEKYWYEARPIFSTIHLSNQDYLGDIVLANFDLESFEKVRESVSEGFLSVDKVDYAISKRYSKSLNQLNVPILFDLETKKIASLDKINIKPSVSVIIPTDFKKSKNYGIEKSILSLLRITTNINFEIVLIYHKKKRNEFIQLLSKFRNTTSIEGLEYDEDFNFSKVINLGVDTSKHEIIFLMNDDIILDNSSDLNHLISHLEFEKNLGSVGIRLFDEFGKILHAGLEYRNGEPQHFLKGSEINFLKNAHEVCREVSGCTGAFLAFTKSNFYKVGKMNEYFPLDYNDVDLMLKNEENKLKNMICSKVSAIHAESLTRGKTGLHVLEEDLKRLTGIHGKLPQRDPFLYTPADRIHIE